MPLENLFAIGPAYGTLSIVDVRSFGYRFQALSLPVPGLMPINKTHPG